MDSNSEDSTEANGSLQDGDKSVLVSDIPPELWNELCGTLKDRLTIAFQKRQYGGGDVQKVEILSPSEPIRARVSFTNTEDAERIRSKGKFECVIKPMEKPVTLTCKTEAVVLQPEAVVDRMTSVYEEVRTDSLQIPKEIQDAFNILLNETNVGYDVVGDVVVIKGDLAKFEVIIKEAISMMMQDPTEVDMSDEFMKLVGQIRLDQLPLPISAVITSLNSSRCKWSLKEHEGKVLLRVKGHLHQLIQVNDYLVAMLVKDPVACAISANLRNDSNDEEIPNSNKATWGCLSDVKTSVSGLHHDRLQNVSATISSKVSSRHSHSLEHGMEYEKNTEENLGQNETGRDEMHANEATDISCQKTGLLRTSKTKCDMTKGSGSNSGGSIRKIDSSSKDATSADSNDAVAQIPQHNAHEVGEQDKYWDPQQYDDEQHKSVTKSPPPEKGRANKSITEKPIKDVSLLTKSKFKPQTNDHSIDNSSDDMFHSVQGNAEKLKGLDNKSHSNPKVEITNTSVLSHDTTKNRNFQNGSDINHCSANTTTTMGEKGAEKGKVFSTATSDQPEINADSNSHSSCDCKPESPQNNGKEKKDLGQTLKGAGKSTDLSAPDLVTVQSSQQKKITFEQNSKKTSASELEEKRAGKFDVVKNRNNSMIMSQSQAHTIDPHLNDLNVHPDQLEMGSSSLSSSGREEEKHENTENSVQDSDQRDGGSFGMSGHQPDDKRADSEFPTERSTKGAKTLVHSLSSAEKRGHSNHIRVVQDDPQLLHFIFLMRSQAINELKVKHGASIDFKDKNDTKVYVVLKKSCTNEDADKARDDFIKLLQCVKKNLRCRIIDLRGRSIDSQKKEKAKKIIVEKERQNKVCRVEPANEDVVKLYSENEKMLDDIVKKACKALDITPPKGDSKFIKDTHTKDHQSAQSMKTSKESDGNATKNTHISEKVKESDMNTREKSKSSNNPSGKEIDMLQKSKTLTMKECPYLLQIFYNTCKYEITQLSKLYNVHIKFDPSIDAGALCIVPGDECVAQSLELTKEKLKTLLQAVLNSLEKEVIDFSNNSEVTKQNVQNAQGMLEIYKHSVSFDFIPKQRFVLYSDNKQLLRKAKNVVLTSLELSSQIPHVAGSNKDKVQSEVNAKLSESPTDESNRLTKKATAGEDMLSFIFHVYTDTLDSISNNNGVKFEWTEGHDVVIKPAKDNGKCTEQNLEDAYEKFVSFVQTLHTKMISKEIDLKGKGLSDTRIRQAIRVTHAAHDKIRVIESNEQIRILGEASEVKLATDTFCNHLGVSIPQSRHGGRRRGGPSNMQRSNSSDDKTDQERKVLLEFEVGKPKRTKVSVCQGDITKERVDAISNAANERLDHAGGVAGAILKAGGYSIQKESHDIIQREGRYINKAEVVYTKAGNLPCKWVLHVVGPVWNERNTDKVKEILQYCCINLLTMAEGLGAKSVAIPAIGTGIYGVPNHVCAEVMYHAVVTYLESQHNKGILDEIHFIDIDRETTKAFTRIFQAKLEKDGSFYMSPADIGYDTMIYGYGPPFNTKGTNTGLNELDMKQLTEGQVMERVKLYSEATRGVSDDPLKGSPTSSQRGAIPKSSSRGSSTTDDRSKGATENTCSICLDDIEEPKKLPCNHKYCTACIDQSEKVRGPICPICKQTFGVVTGDMPNGKMTYSTDDYRKLPGFPKCGRITITYNFPSGYQTDEHPNPGRRYTGTTRIAYLPNNPEGQEVLKLLKIAFDRRLTFTIGRSVTTGATDVVTWNDIHHKTNIHGGAEGYGYPDPDYLTRVKEELAAKGVK